ncbi:vWA domain-containing protein [Flavilitoribacter nigricans]|uniref:VWFA domain-containing protein n=2 Tax=Flavilitoribacter TaxID=2762562 RepID=A0A2D0N8R1_FLAN2|nr:hypothetical protein CRP01_20385 [Flavilitoribacter nigricans DSM 23189 = NBRC 102662]
MTKIRFLLTGLSGICTILFFVSWLTPVSTQVEIRGIVTDSITGDPLPGVNVLIHGTSQGTVTDFDGKFQIEVAELPTVLEVIYIGYVTQKVSVTAAQKELQIELSTSPEVLEEVVVTGYQTQKKRSKPAKVQSREMAAGARLQGRALGIMASPVPASRPKADRFNTEDYSTINENRFLRPLNAPRSTFSIDVDAASYSNLRRFINEGQVPPKDAIRIEEMVNYFEYDYPQPRGYEPFTVSTEIGACPWQPEHRLLHIGLQGKRLPTAQIPASNLVFLLDVSGSMSDPNKLPLVQESLKMLTDNLRPEDKVAIVVYAGAAGVVLPSTSGSDKQKIKDAMTALEAGGSTAGGAGIKLAYKIARENFVEGGNNRIILATDGDFNVGASSDSELVRMIEKERESGVFLTVLGFGMGNYKDNKMQQLADKGNGNHAYIDNLNEARKVLVTEFGGTLFTIAKDVKLQIEFNPAKVAGYRLIGYENRLLNDEDFADDKKDAGEMGAGHTVTALYEIIPAGVESTFLADVDQLKYQEVKTKNDGIGDLCTVKLRYKQPDGQKSQLIEQPVADVATADGSLSNNFHWSAAVAQWGMLLRDSEFKGNANLADCRALAERAKGSDRNGYRAEMISLMDKMQQLTAGLAAEK